MITEALMAERKALMEEACEVALEHLIEDRPVVIPDDLMRRALDCKRRINESLVGK